MICFPSLLLCLRAVVGAQVLKYVSQKAVVHDEMLFINFWYVLILANDVFIILGTCFKFVLEYKVFDSALLTATGMLLGVGTLFVWIGILRYLGFFSRYNILILTLNRSLPNVLRFTFCAGLLYFGFLFCGYVVLGPYNMKFRTLMMSSECLYSLINGDDMFATFSTTSDKSTAVLWFSRIYFYTFISLFIYVVLSLFISILMDSYESLKVILKFIDFRSHKSEFRRT
ncbi:unnamed protein product [Soboliphyme baturini]|uniref:PKD_channel domain-containing protein n=1 Tax=Soboliphyme baturini TaxID=241478 RepID=A0A183J335_9BILA|nr:unnamed protein product [Soboliphyme baturini]